MGIFRVVYFGVVNFSSVSQGVIFFESGRLLFFNQDFLDFPGGIQPPLPRSGAPGCDFFLPHVAVHVFRPEGPGAALPGTGLVDRALTVFEKGTVPVFVSKLVPRSRKGEALFRRGDRGNPCQEKGGVRM